MTVYTLFPDRTVPLEPDPCATGAVLSGTYRVVRRLGWGGMGVVYEGRTLDTAQRVIIKVLHPMIAGESRAVDRLQEEARVVSGLRHGGIVELIDLAETEDGLPAIITEYLRGEGLLVRLAKCAPLEPVDAIGIAVQVLEALDAAHAAGITHLALKPENVFLAEGPMGLDRVKVLDWGFGGYCRATSTRPDPLSGTAAYLSPEQSCGRQPDARTDLYAVGVMLYEMLSACLPYRGDSYQVMAAMAAIDPVPVEELEPALPADLATLVGKAMSRDQRERFQTPREFERALTRLGKPRRGAQRAASTLLDTLGPIPDEDLQYSIARSNAAGTWAIILLLALDGGGLLAYSALPDRFEGERIALVEPAPSPAPRLEPRIAHAPRARGASPERTVPGKPRRGAGRWLRTRFEPNLNYGGPPRAQRW